MKGGQMAKTTAWLVTIIGLLLLLKVMGVLAAVTDYNDWLIAIAVLVIRITKLIKK